MSIDLGRTSLTYKHMANPAPTPEIKYDNGFWSDTQDEFMMSWIGQLIQRKFIFGERVYEEGEPEEGFDPLDPELMKGFEPYAKKFIDINNIKSHNRMKSIIASNIQRRANLDASDRVWGPQLVAMLGQPEIYIPIPLAKGIGFTRRFVKGAAIGAGLTIPTEPIRQSLDPTATIGESAMIIGGSAVMSGLLSGIVPPLADPIVRAFGKKINTNGSDKPGPVAKKGFEDLREKKAGETYFKAHNENEGAVDWETTPFTWRLADDTTKNAKVEFTNDPRPFTEIIGRRQTDRGEVYGKRYPAKFDEQEAIMYIDEVQIKSNYYQLQKGTYKTDIIEYSPENFISVDDYISFEMKAEVLRSVYEPYSRWIKANPGGNRASYDNHIYAQALNELKQEPPVRSTLSKWNPFNWWLKLTSNYYNATQRIQDDGFLKTVQDAFADSAHATRGNSKGVATTRSALAEGALDFKIDQVRLTDVLDRNFLLSKGLDADVDINRFGFNPEIVANRVASRSRKIKNTFTGNEVDVTTGEYEAFAEQVTFAIMSPKYYNNASKFIRDTADEYKAYFAEMDQINLDLQLYESDGGLTKRIASLEEVQKFGLETLDDPKVSRATKQEIIDFMRETLDPQINALNASKKALAKKGDMTPVGEHYVSLFASPSKIQKSTDSFVELWTKVFMKQGLSETDAVKAATGVKDEILRLGSMGEDAYTLQLDGKNKVFKLGSTNLMRKQINVPYEDLVESGLMEFYEKNIKQIATRYSFSIRKVHAMASKFDGDPFGQKQEYFHYIDMLKKYGKTKKDRAEIRNMVQSFRNLMDRHYHTFNTTSPDTMNKQIVEVLKNVSSLGVMGGVVVSSLTEIARPTMVHGFSKAFPLLKEQILKDGNLYRQVLKDLHLETGRDLSIVFGSMNRMMTETGYAGSSSKVPGFDRVHNTLNKSQIPFYWMNGLTPWTFWFKNFSTMLSYQSLIIDCNVIAKGINPITKKKMSAKQIKIATTKLAQYGVDLKSAKVIAKFVDDGVIEREGNLFLANTGVWDRQRGGKAVREKIRFAIHNYNENTIITPNINDTPNLVAGAKTFTGDTAKAIFDNPIGARMFGAEKTPYGYKMNMSYASLPFQFMPWAFSATNKMLINGGQALSRGEFNTLAHASAMVGLGALVVYIKNPYGFESMTNEEIIAESIDRSGLLTLFTDINYMLESLSEGFLDEPVGIRPMLDMDSRFDRQDRGEAIGELAGPGLSIPLDIARIYFGDYNYKTEHQVIRSMLPLQNLIFAKKLIRPMYDAGLEKVLE
jgi:hypothetical protein